MPVSRLVLDRSLATVRDRAAPQQPRKTVPPLRSRTVARQNGKSTADEAVIDRWFSVVGRS
jgi:hypothetical protein